MDFNYQLLKTKLSQYDVITFDVFDTLITRMVLHPTDVFSLVQLQLLQQGHKAGSFAKDRIQAEQLAYEQYGDTANFDQIYQMLNGSFSYSEEQCRIFQQMEFETELQLAIPRCILLQLVKELKGSGKRIILCSDMYLSSAQIRMLLRKCSYPEDLEIRVSSECGGTKSSGFLFEALYSQLPPSSKIIHIGDNDHSDYRVPLRLHRDAVLLPSGCTMFTQSPLYDYLSSYEDNINNCLILGYLVNYACFNSPFSEEQDKSRAVSVWGGTIFSCFMDFLLRQKDESKLLFVTREGYLLQKMYQRYCLAADVRPQENALFYASRTAAVAASIDSEEGIRNAMRHPKFDGTVKRFLQGRMNLEPPEDMEFAEEQIRLPAQRHEFFQQLKPWFSLIYKNAENQGTAYRTYTEQFRTGRQPFTIVDVGYNGTIQYALSHIMKEKIGGLYMFLNDGAYPSRIGCPCASMAVTNAGIHPLYENLLFLEAVMQVPYGQLQKMEIQGGKVTPHFCEDGNFSPYISEAQEQFCQFAEWTGLWKKRLGDGMQLDFSLAESIWVCLLKFRYLPRALLESFWLTDNYSGTPMLKYDDQTQCWNGNGDSIPLEFQLLKTGEHLRFKQRVKRFVKTHIPYYLYDWACEIWMKYIK